MDYLTSFFGKNLDALEYDDIIDFFSEEKEESDKIEFKSYSLEYGNFKNNLEGVIRGICAFLNSDGGILIWGAPVGQTVEGKKEKIFKGELTPLNEFKEKDWLINKVSDSVTPLPIGINVKPLTKEGKYLYIFQIQKSIYSPHQFKNTYYARLDGQTKPAPHYLIEALFRKISYPNVEAYIGFDKAGLISNKYFLDITIYLFNFTELQNEENVYFRLICPQGIFANYSNPQFQNYYSSDGHQLTHKGLIDLLHFGSPNVHNERIIIDPYTLEANGKKLDLLLAFGGKKSPLKFCDYKLDFSILRLNGDENFNYLLMEKEENILFSRKQEESNLTKEERLKKILKR